MRRCSRCGRERPDEDFAWRRIDKGWREAYCRPCRAAYKQGHYAQNKQRYVDQAQARNEALVRERTRYLIEYFRSHPCVDCGESDPVVLEFDHLEQKEFEIGAGLRGRKWNSILIEMEKCEVVCVNCHRRRTAIRVGSYRFRAIAEERNAGQGEAL